MYALVADLVTPEWSGEVGRQSCERLAEAEALMARWARFGVDSYCTEPTGLRILDAAGVEVVRWNWTRKRPEAVTGAVTGAEPGVELGPDASA